MAEKTKIIGPLSMDIEGAKKISKSFLLTVGAAGIVAVGDIIGLIDLGSYQNLLVIGAPFVLNVLRKWLGSYESTA